ncbi:thioether cross-link-forming SCIFF peptide maturase [Ruminiclostridium herbifermentans]|uniref:Thioether cross-link-forming SCIFF peptide maturase n=1 Tax=Ruminiclostridium herbifermentans TaxID=2488810 RepID=A0A4U7JI83_9FIRM|nr:thioether cross-link-forming SCIFF peptide maturase [Ruminiclostridium herbifermentans]QNU65430.1 thioether cross-link-forming SCIFF peptide maturase [Ruminiclostridium herbifermentans]
MIHKYIMHGTNIVMDINSGAVHVFDAAAYDVVDLYKTKTKEQVIEALSQKYDGQAVSDAYDEIAQLEADGLLFSEDVYLDAINNWERKPVVKALCLHICHDCNLRCKYCFASTGSFGGHRTMMDVETGKKAIDFLIEKSAGRRNLEVDFFGGEPLMNFEVVKQIVEYARIREKETNKNFRFTITTNAVLLNEDNKEFINKNMHNVVLSIDGRKEVNDNMRPRVDGSGTYESILPKLKDMAESRNQDNYYVRGTFTRENLDFSKDVLHLADLGFKQISVEPVVAAKDSGLDIREEDLDKLFTEYESLAMEYINRDKNKEGFNFFHFMIDLSQGPCILKRLGGCGSGHEYLAVTPEGDLYPCHQFVGDEKFKMGNVHCGEFNSDFQMNFQKSNVYTKKECSECWAKFYCSGGCAANAYQFNNDINVPYKIGCELEKKRVECAIWIKTQE